MISLKYDDDRQKAQYVLYKGPIKNSRKSAACSNVSREQGSASAVSQGVNA